MRSSLEDVEGSSLWRTWIGVNLVPCGDGRTFHITHGLYTGDLKLAVGDVGNRGMVAPH